MFDSVHVCRTLTANSRVSGTTLAGPWGGVVAGLQIIFQCLKFTVHVADLSLLLYIRCRHEGLCVVRGTSGLHAHCRLFPGDGCLDARRELFLDKKKRPQRERVGSFISSLPRALFGKCPHLHRVPTISYPHTISLPPFPRNFNSFAYSAATSMHTTCSSAIYNHPLPTTPSPRMPGC